MAERPGIDLTQGKLMTTGRDLDIAIKDAGWIAVQAPTAAKPTPAMANLQLDANGQLTTANGHPVLGNGGPIAIPPAEKIQIGEDGTISIRPLGEGPENLVVVDRIRWSNLMPKTRSTKTKPASCA
jgi:flagellar basal-body rod protein FlgF